MPNTKQICFGHTGLNPSGLEKERFFVVVELVLGLASRKFNLIESQTWLIDSWSIDLHYHELIPT